MKILPFLQGISSNRKVPKPLQGAMSGFTGTTQSGLSGIVPFKQRVPNTSGYNFRNPVTGE